MRLRPFTGCLSSVPKEGGFKRDENNPLAADLIVIDETSMVDTILMYHFLKAVPKEATLILVGECPPIALRGGGDLSPRTS